MSMTPARYNELTEKIRLFAFTGERDGMPASWLDVIKNVRDNGIVEDPPGWFPQEEITALLQETGMSVPELREWVQVRESEDQEGLDRAVERTLLP